jgi:hypothetical protein
MRLPKTAKLGYTMLIIVERSRYGIQSSLFVVIAKFWRVLAVDLCRHTKITRFRKIRIGIGIHYSTVDSAQFSSYAPSRYQVYLRKKQIGKDTVPAKPLCLCCKLLGMYSLPSTNKTGQIEITHQSLKIS